MQDELLIEYKVITEALNRLGQSNEYVEYTVRQLQLNLPAVFRSAFAICYLRFQAILTPQYRFCCKFFSESFLRLSLGFCSGAEEHYRRKVRSQESAHLFAPGVTRDN